MTATPDLDLAAAIEQGARGIALPVASNRHGQLCPVWDRRAYGPAIESCDCWILANARRDAKIAVEAAAGLIAEQAARHALIVASELLWQWAEGVGDNLDLSAVKTARKRVIKACARKIAPEPTGDEMRTAVGQLLAGMRDCEASSETPFIES